MRFLWPLLDISRFTIHIKTADQGVNVAGLNTTVFPVRSAGKALRHMAFTGLTLYVTYLQPNGYSCSNSSNSDSWSAPGWMASPFSISVDPSSDSVLPELS